MPTLQNVIKIDQANYDTLVSTGSVTIAGVTYTYNDNNIYLIEEPYQWQYDSTNECIKLIFTE